MPMYNNIILKSNGQAGKASIFNSMKNTVFPSLEAALEEKPFLILKSIFHLVFGHKICQNTVKSHL